jgi:cell division septation protein DedD
MLLFFLAAWMFVLGVLVGRGTAPVHFDTRALQKELVAMRDAMTKKERGEVEKAVRGEDEKAPLEFYEALKKDGPDTAVQIPVSPAPAGPSGSAGQSAEAPTRPHKTRADIMPKKTTVAVKTPAGSIPSKPPPAAANGRLTIQVSALKDGAAARRIVANLKKDGYPAYVEQIRIADKGVWFRVRVGSYQDRQQAAADMERLTRGRRKPILVEK